MNKVNVAGVGMISFVKPGQSEPYAVMGAEAARLAPQDVRWHESLAGLLRLAGRLDEAEAHEREAKRLRNNGSRR